MATILFVHGTGVRRAGYKRSLKRIQSGIQKLGLNSIKVEGCLWGDPPRHPPREGAVHPALPGVEGQTAERRRHPCGTVDESLRGSPL